MSGNLLFRYAMFASVVLLGYVLPQAVEAQSQPSKYDQPRLAYVKVTWIELIRPAFREVMSLEERQHLETITFPPYREGFDAHAGINQHSRATEINTVFLAGIDFVADAAVIAERDGLHSQFNGYLAYLLRKLPENVSGRAHRESVKSVAEFSDFLGLSQTAATNFQATEQFKRQKLLVLQEGLAFVLAHDIGHRVLGHAQSTARDPKDHRRREAEADSYAVRLGMAAGYSPILASSIYRFLVMLESDLQGYSRRARQRMIVCRMEGFFWSGLEIVVDHPEFRKFLRTHPKAHSIPENWRKQISLLHSEGGCG